VLGTLDPRIPALGAWQPVEMSNGYGGDAQPGRVIDLSVSHFAGEDAAQAGTDPDDQHAAVAASMRKLAGKPRSRHPDLSASMHVDDAANALDSGHHDGAIRHLNLGVANLTPHSLRQHA
jgi:hypothetical protein